MGLFGPSRDSLRRHAHDQGADAARWLPTYVDLGKLNGLDNVKMEYSFAVASTSHLLVYECERELYGKRDISDPFRYVREYNGRIPFAAVSAVLASCLSDDAIKASRRGAFWKDLAWNKSIGAALGLSSKSVTMASLVVLETPDVASGHTPHVAFGIPHKGDVGGAGFGFIGDLLPDGLSEVFEIGSLAHDYRETSGRDEAAAVNAMGMARGLLALMGRGADTIGVPTSTLAHPRARGITL